jgi:hypothetical protein
MKYRYNKIGSRTGTDGYNTEFFTIVYFNGYGYDIIIEMIYPLATLQPFHEQVRLFSVANFVDHLKKEVA